MDEWLGGYGCALDRMIRWIWVCSWIIMHVHTTALIDMRKQPSTHQCLATYNMLQETGQCQVMSPDDAVKWCHQMMLSSDVTRWCCQVMSPDDAVKWCHQMMLCKIWTIVNWKAGNFIMFEIRNRVNTMIHL